MYVNNPLGIHLHVWLFVSCTAAAQNKQIKTKEKDLLGFYNKREGGGIASPAIRDLSISDSDVRFRDLAL